jgi:hypothetical protein
MPEDPERRFVHAPRRARASRREAVLIGLAIFASGFACAGLIVANGARGSAQAIDSEMERFRSRYGPAQNSQFGEEWIIRDFFNGERDGVFVDVGASHPRTRCHALFVSDVSNDEAKVYFLENQTRVTSSNRGFTERYGAATELTTPTVTLDDLLDMEGIAAIDFLSMDIELAEPGALAGFDIDRFRPRLVCIEAHAEVRQQILDYFARHQYVVVGKYLRADTQNLYFTPRAP